MERGAKVLAVRGDEWQNVLYSTGFAAGVAEGSFHTTYYCKDGTRHLITLCLPVGNLKTNRLAVHRRRGLQYPFFHSRIL